MAKPAIFDKFAQLLVKFCKLGNIGKISKQRQFWKISNKLSRSLASCTKLGCYKRLGYVC